MITEWELSEYRNTKALWIVIKKERLLTVNFILLNFNVRKSLHRNDRFVTVHYKCSKSHRQRQFTLQLLWEDGVFVWVHLDIYFCGQQNPKCEWAIHLVYPPFIRKRHPSSNYRNKNLTELGLEIQTAVSR